MVIQLNIAETDSNAVHKESCLKYSNNFNSRIYEQAITKYNPWHERNF